MRNGNQISVNNECKRDFSSYRTYEEWKPSSSPQSVHRFVGSYRTYEEWKRNRQNEENQGNHKFLPYLWGMETNAVLSSSTCFVNRSYRTYEEWKRNWKAKIEHTTPVLTVPMRNGNIPSICFCNSVRASVLTVPMRNGNFPWWRTYCPRQGQFLPYLWGMETWISTTTLTRLILVLTVPMRNGNCQTCYCLVQMPPSSYRTYEEWKRLPTHRAC